MAMFDRTFACTSLCSSGISNLLLSSQARSKIFNTALYFYVASFFISLSGSIYVAVSENPGAPQAQRT